MTAFFKSITISLLCIAISACGQNSGDLQTSAPPAPSGVKVGDPYKIAGKWYTPETNPTYNQVGIASWYGADFHNKQTANGETYNMNALTAAHTTLPMPSYVRVTNLENNRSLILRVNDRGPFVNNRLIDVSRRGAQLLGFERRGTTRVRVQAVDGPNAPAQVALSNTPPPLQRQAVERVAVESLELLSPPTQIGQQPTPPVQMAALTPQAKQAIAANDDIYVQVGAYSSIGRAADVISALQHLGEAGMESVNINGRKLYRVRVGNFNTSSTANSALRQILALGHNTAKVVFD
ncbi:MAG: septal ring lytic transglycosylase RlpA family protein [Kordiimonadaceae bacterium]|nr:septal ring lytic transglycosylase RlpA family protein [Kordiimonadaceae bacterium]MBT6031099.1 septal ring lytic transglycosylase RlpA family protein [Kordiimonadaceae bacterium]